MQTIIEEVIIKASPERIWNFLVNLHKNNNYEKWHPTDHIAYSLRNGSMGKIGGTAYFAERLGRFTFKLTYKVTKANYPHYLEYEASSPLSWLCFGRGSFLMKPIDPYNTRFVAYVEYGYTVLFVGKIIDRIVEKVVQLENIRKHMHEEGKNLKIILEEK